MRNVKVVSFEFVKDESGSSAERTEEVRNLIAQMIELSHKRGRPTKFDEEEKNAA
ncbi:MAG: hypothetical protein JNM39_07650 [Bdellovibrionaceae bacterium]|nr:hypothetical protein [Pseudobdellovibrionaceae bacterium]